MQINGLKTGPIVGWTQENKCRLWGRGEEGTVEKRCFGIARIRKSNTKNFGKPIICKMMPVFDYSGVVDFENLNPATKYDYQFGYLNKDTEPNKINLATAYDWSQASTGQFITENYESATETDFVFGSCRYLLKLFGGSFFDGRGDKVFRSINKQIAKGMKTDFMLMVGDQIYADDLNALFPDDTLEDFFSRYRDVFGQDHIREMMAVLPTYMILDDHEIRDNWSNDDRASHPHLYAAAMHAYQSYQMIHGPAFSRKRARNRSEVPDNIWFDFDSGSSSFFVLDTRTERTRKSHPPEMISRFQLDRLKTWLNSSRNRKKPKFVVSSVPMFPDGHRLDQDKWQGYDEQRKEILDFIRERNIRHVVFLSGDIHCSMSAQVKCAQDSDFVVTSVISSSLFWPYPQGQASSYRLSGTLTESAGAIYTIQNAGPVYSKDNFTRLNVKNDILSVRVYDRKGSELTKAILKYSI